MRKGDAVPDMTPPAPLVEQRHTDAATGYYANAESLAMHFARFDNDRTAMLVEALREAERALAAVVEGDPMGCGKNSKCKHGRYGCCDTSVA